MVMMRRARQVIAGMGGAALLAGCVAAQDPDAFWSDSAYWSGGHSDRAIVAVAKGDYAEAERQAAQALRDHPNDPYALLAAAISFDQSGRPNLARQYYETILALQPSGNVAIGTGAGPRPIVDVAGERLAALEALPRHGAALPQNSPASPRAVAAAHRAEIPGQDPVVQRFLIMARLLDEGLMTRDEYDRRRNANIGALLPYSSLPPAAGLDRPVPGGDEVAQRLRAIGQALERGAVTPREHGAERNVILDALMPAQAREQAAPPPRPRDVLEVAQAMGRLERLREDDLITDPEYLREKVALEGIQMQLAGEPTPEEAGVVLLPTSILPNGAPPASATSPAPPPSKPAATARPAPARTPAAVTALHLASLRSESQARREWESLKKRFPELLDPLHLTVARVDLGDGKGVFHRVMAGPVTAAQAETLCREFRQRRQFCEPGSLE
ncbi:hypothetical protein [Telmatospirillum sp. J64-1]|uniref:tetratricopeptide repeat protein n=1 Tax=Telmatospirillum sp. J64-1 TaxID=2502183 RepID=UPI00115C5905|nr:hypothetical protein [Telmatospirillum sp. J64-1]